MQIMRIGLVRGPTVMGAIVLVGIAARCCEGQTTRQVQLPTFRSFGVATTVLVPDRGTVYLGGVNRSGRGQNGFGLPLGGRSNRGLANASSAGGVSISATIIDLDELDRAVLAEAARRRGEKLDALGRPVETVPRSRTAASRGKTIESRASNKYMRLGLQAEIDGDFQSARIFYEMATERGGTSH